MAATDDPVAKAMTEVQRIYDGLEGMNQLDFIAALEKWINEPLDPDDDDDSDLE